ncbi:MAG: 1,4-alpha-glucan branching protein GlgB [Deltaproteobacteria bacterium]|nr:1,4-alpha-glucan branching protein GlgB [Deltaproteobacteria bacterium]
MAALPSIFGADDLHFFNEGTHDRLHEKLGAHPRVVDGAWGTGFAVWAPNADAVSVVGSFNAWDGDACPMSRVGGSGVWEAFAPGVGKGALYKYRIEARGRVFDKADPFAALHETPPATASIVWDQQYKWGDERWRRERRERNAPNAPISIYEVHLGSFARVPDEGWRSLTYRELAPRLADHALAHGFTHVELLPVMEHPFFGSWGYQITGYFAPSHRYGRPEDLMALIDHLHQRGLGVILDWAPAHFPADAHALALFDGTHLYEHEDPRRGFHPDWKSCIFNYGRHEVRSFLLSSASYWIDKFHADGLRVDGVASMLYLDYSRAPGEWIPNEHGGRENLEAVSLLQQINDTLARKHPDVIVIAEESTSWPRVTGPTREGGLGFHMKWDLGWMHDTLRYLARDPIHRRYHQDELTFRSVYATSERFVLPLSHDEVVHGKGSLVNKMPGDRWQKFANVRLLFAMQHAMPGKKLLFMGGEIGQWREWNHDSELDWGLLDDPAHAGLSRLVTDLNALHAREPALHRLDFDPAGFLWVDGTDADHSVLAFLRLGGAGTRPVLVVVSLTPVVRSGYAVGVPLLGRWTEILATDAEIYGGSGVGNLGGVEALDAPCDGFDHRVEVTLPPLGCSMFLGPEAWDGVGFERRRPASVAPEAAATPEEEEPSGAR